MTTINEEQRAATGHDFLHRTIADVDPEIADAIRLETQRQNDTLELIASENHVSKAVLTAMGSVFTNKYAEGYPAKRYYGGCGPTDIVESIAIERARKAKTVRAKVTMAAASKRSLLPIQPRFRSRIRGSAQVLSKSKPKNSVYFHTRSIVRR